MKSDVLVLGAGIVGVSAALALQSRGRSTVLIDREPTPGRGVSFGNAGLIERASLSLLVFPRDFKEIGNAVFGRTASARIDWLRLLQTASWLGKYYYESAPARAAAHARGALPLIERSVLEHQAFAQAAQCQDLLRPIGWIKAYRTQEVFARAEEEAKRLRDHDLRCDVLDAQALAMREPLARGFCGAAHYLDPVSVSDPYALTAAYAGLFQERGGIFLQGDAATLEETGLGWRVATSQGAAEAREAVVALGPWSDDLFRKLGYEFPLGVKRGYHMHYSLADGARLRHPVLDAEGGYVLAPMAAGVRLTTGAEFTTRDAPPCYAQLTQAETLARQRFPLKDRLDAEPWMGARPCLPDLLPIIGPAPRHHGLWFDFGHQHHGLTLGPASARLLAEMMTGEAPFADPSPYSAERF